MALVEMQPWRMMRWILACLLLAACGAGPGARPLPDEATLIDHSPRDYWLARAARGDPVAPVALALTDPSRAGSPLAAIAMNALDGPPPAGLAAALAHAHHTALARDTAGTPARLSAAEVAGYHFRVFADFGLPRTAFGGAQLTGTLAEARLTSALWCPACDRAP